MRSQTILLGLILPAAAMQARAWDAHGHRTITYLALDGFRPVAPAWIRDPAALHRIAFQANEIDRWRGWNALPLAHINNPNHYLDLDLLPGFGLTLESLPKLRREYLKAMIIAKHEHPDQAPPYDASRDAARTREWPGFLAHAISEQYALLCAAFNQVRILEALNDPARRHQLAQARANALYHMGILAHLVGDGAQPLHTTKHHHGWVGPNPEGFTTDRGFHRMIDGAITRLHPMTYDQVRPFEHFDRKIDPADPWDDIIAYIAETYDQVVPLYRLERDGELRKEPGRKFIIGRITAAADMLAAMYKAAWEISAPTPKQIETWKHYNNFDPARLPKYPPATQPAGRARKSPSARRGTASHGRPASRRTAGQPDRSASST